ncbi:phosphoserine phosphatase SerB [Catenovulum maritimum]|uniref:Phosphoserine phosphatase n=1 Tax=Catenovulum maritimum TaxID=1513271 RepID=A0A0J8GPU7_9ALTE|nr:phosphoserine phosphatase SerB [Catenovulum maritimum]KMT64792.1 hypothetical protein XM47_13110 [Catenovulum maritimum]
MNNYIINETIDLSTSKHIGRSYLSSLDNNGQQTIVLDPKDLKSYALGKSENANSIKNEIVIYGESFTLENLDHVLNKLSSSIINIAIIPALDGEDDCAISFQLSEKIDTETFNSLKLWASEFKADVWQLSERANINQPGLLLMDMDSTVIKIECIDEIAKLAGVGEEVAKVTELAMQGKLDFAESLKGRVGTLANCNEGVLQTVAENLPLMHGLERLVKVLKAHNWRLAIASGGFTFFADKLKDLLQLDAAVANVLEIKDGVLTGKVIGGIVDAQVKADTLGKLASEFSIENSQTIAMGDGANDLVMMAAAGLGVAFEAKPLVQEKADVAINFHGLDALLFILSR